jgi:hypothetical protein
MRLIRPRWASVKEFLWRAFSILLATWFDLGAVGAFVDYWRVHTVYIEGVVIFGTSLVVWMIAMLVSRDAPQSVSRNDANRHNRQSASHSF